MGWLKNIFKPEKVVTMPSRSSEDVVRFYQELGFFAGKHPSEVLGQYHEEFGDSLNPAKSWDDVFLLSLSKEAVWASDPEADVCAENLVYTEALKEWAAISSGAFNPTQVQEDWKGESGPVKLNFSLGENSVTVTPQYLEDWVDLDVLQQINTQIESSGRQFAYTVDGNFCVVLCLTSEQKEKMRQERQFPFAW